MLGIVGEKSCQVGEIPSSARRDPCNVVVLHALDIRTELQGMGPMCPERIVSELIIIEGVLVIGGRSDAPLIPRIATTDGHDRGRLSRSAAQRCECRCGINRPEGYEVERVTAAVTNSRRIDDTGTKRVALPEHNGLPSGMRLEENVVEAVGLREVRVVIQVRSEQAVICRKLVIYSGGIEIFRHNLQAGVDELPFVLSGGSGCGMGKHCQLRR